MIFQDPLSSLHPAYKVGWQITEMIHAHDTLISRKKARAPGRGAAGPRRHPARRRPARRLPAPVLRRHAAAGDDRDGDGAQPGPPDRRRADHRPRRHRAGPGAGGDAPAPGGVRHRDRADHPRPGRGRGDGRRRRGDVRREDHGEGVPPRHLLPLPQPLHRGAVQVAARPAAHPGAAAVHRRVPAEPHQPPDRVPVPAAMPLRVRPVRRGPAPRAGLLRQPALGLLAPPGPAGAGTGARHAPGRGGASA